MNLVWTMNLLQDITVIREVGMDQCARALSVMSLFHTLQLQKRFFVCSLEDNGMGWVETSTLPRFHEANVLLDLQTAKYIWIEMRFYIICGSCRKSSGRLQCRGLDRAVTCTVIQTFLRHIGQHLLCLYLGILMFDFTKEYLTSQVVTQLQVKFIQWKYEFCKWGRRWGIQDAFRKF